MAKNCLIYEALNDVNGMKVTKHGDLMTLSGVFGVCGVRNNNQRIYEASNYTRMVDEMKERIKNDGGIPGELEHPQMMNITLENISHKITDINIDENGVVTGTITLLNTPKGQIAQAIVEGGIPLHISSRATGAVDPKTGCVTLEKIATYDLVGTPGFSQARLNLNESQMAQFDIEMKKDGKVEIENNIYTQISESQVYYITEKENNIEQDMDNKEIMEKLEDLSNEIKRLNEEVEELTNENNELREMIDEMETPQNFDLEKLANGIQKWIIEEYSPMVQKWILEEYNESAAQDMMNEVTESIENDIVEKIAPAIQNWAINEFAPGIQGWVINEFAPEVENWMNESYKPSIENIIKESIEENKSTNLDAIEGTLKLLEGLETTKPSYSKKSLITENADEPKFVQQMPADARVKWDLASNEVKESIMRRAKIYNFVNEGAIERFWNSINFEDIKPSQNIYEGLDNIIDEHERAIRAKIRASRFRKF